LKEYNQVVEFNAEMKGEDFEDYDDELKEIISRK